MASTREGPDSAMRVLLALLTEPEQKAVLAHIGEHGLHRDDTVFVLVSLLKIGGVLVMQIADAVDAQTHAQGDMAEYLTGFHDRLFKRLDHHREAMTDRWGDILRLAGDIEALLDGHGVALAAQADTIKRLTKGLDQRVEALRPLLDLLRAEPRNAFSPTALVLDNLAQATRDGVKAGLAAQRGGRWSRWLTYGRDLAWTLGLAILLYRTWM